MNRTVIQFLKSVKGKKTKIDQNAKNALPLYEVYNLVTKHILSTGVVKKHINKKSNKNDFI